MTDGADISDLAKVAPVVPVLSSGRGEDGEDDSDETYILEDAIETVYDRPDQHGEPEDSFPRIAAMWSAYLDTEVEPHEVADLMVLLKVARNAEGVYHADNYVDMAGYAENGARLNAETDGREAQNDH